MYKHEMVYHHYSLSTVVYEYPSSKHNEIKWSTFIQLCKTESNTTKLFKFDEMSGDEKRNRAETRMGVDKVSVDKQLLHKLFMN
jgi:hypothetical protein